MPASGMDAQQAVSRICGEIVSLFSALCSFWSRDFTLGMVQDLEAYCDCYLLALCNWHQDLGLKLLLCHVSGSWRRPLTYSLRPRYP